MLINTHPFTRPDTTVTAETLDKNPSRRLQTLSLRLFAARSGYLRISLPAEVCRIDEQSLPGPIFAGQTEVDTAPVGLGCPFHLSVSLARLHAWLGHATLLGARNIYLQCAYTRAYMRTRARTHTHPHTHTDGLKERERGETEEG